MDLHELLRDLVARQGPAVVDSADAFRAALDDFLTEEEATTGELNLLVDAVRLGGVDRLRTLIEHGGDPRAAIAEAGDTFARDRGTDDVARCRWAVAVVGYALGWVEAAHIPTAPSGRTTDLPPPERPPAPTGPPVPQVAPAHPSTDLPPRTFPATEQASDSAAAPPLPGTPTPPSALPPRPPRRTGRVVLIALLVAGVVAGAVGLGMWLGSGDDPSGSPDDPPSEASSPGDGSDGSDDEGGEGGSAAIPVNSALIPLTEDGESRIYAIDVDTGERRSLTSGPSDRVPSISPDRSIVMYVDNPPGGVATPMVLDLNSGQTRPLLTDTSPCESGGRPGFSPSGERVVLICFDLDGEYAGTYVLDLDGQQVGTVPTPGDPQGTPTWTSESSLVFSMPGDTDSAPATLWQAEVDGDSATQLTTGEDGSDTHPDWSAEAGQSGLLLYSRHGVTDFYGDLLTSDAAYNDGPRTQGVSWAHPAWSPDGARILFSQRLEDGTERLAVAPLDDLTDVRPIPGVTGKPGIPAWGTR